jgi:hypothetical protein
MNKFFVPGALLIFLIVMVIITTPKLLKEKPLYLTSSPSPTAQIISSPLNIMLPSQVHQIKIFLIALDDQGKSGIKVGCGDSLITVDKTIDPTTMPLTAAINELLAIKSQYYGESGLYNALYQSNLKLEKASVEEGQATVYLSGNLKLGGVCDNPRFEAQLAQTILQFPTVEEVQIYINNVPLQDLLSEKG